MSTNGNFFKYIFLILYRAFVHASHLETEASAISSVLRNTHPNSVYSFVSLHESAYEHMQSIKQYALSVVAGKTNSVCVVDNVVN